MKQSQATPVGSVPFPPSRYETAVPCGTGTPLMLASFVDVLPGPLLTGGDHCEAFGLWSGKSPVRHATTCPLEARRRFTFRGGIDMEQQEIGLVGSVTRPMHRHPASELKACQKKGHACRLSLVHSGDDQEKIAERIGVTPGYLSMLLSGKRRWNDELQRKFERVTGSWAPFQWDAMKRGIDLHFDAVNVARATGEYIVERARAA